MAETDRYDRQIRFAGLGPGGQERLGRASVVIVGLGAVGGAAAVFLARAGIGHLRLVDFDRVALDNLHRQILFDEADARAGRPKVEAGAEALGRVGGPVEIEPLDLRLAGDNGRRVIGPAEVIIDGLDNQADRYHLNRAAVEARRPLVQPGCSAARANLTVIIPGRTACFQCLHPQPDLADDRPPTLTEGVLGPAAGVAGALAASEAIKLLTGSGQSADGGFIQLDLWSLIWRRVDLAGARRADCPICGRL